MEERHHPLDLTDRDHKEYNEDEVESKVPWMIERGGYIPQVNHGVPPDVSWDSFCYFNALLRKTLGIG